MSDFDQQDELVLDAADEDYVPYVPIRKRKQTEETVTKPKVQVATEPVLTVIQQNELLRPALKPQYELVKDITYEDNMKTCWKPPRHCLEPLYLLQLSSRRQRLQVSVEGLDPIPPLLSSFREMRLPLCIQQHLLSLSIQRPTPIQQQGIPIALSGRDMMAIASTGSGKSIAFLLPMIMRALEYELRLPLVQGEGPVGLLLCPSRELAKQTFDIAQKICASMIPQFPMLRSMLCMGGQDMSSVRQSLKDGVHMVFATPGRLLHMLAQKMFNLNICVYFCMDEGDRLLNLGFEEDVRNILSHFMQQRQTMIFSATMPVSMKTFATSALINPVVVHVGNVGAASLRINQKVIYVERKENIMQALLKALQKTAPPVLIFAATKIDVDEVQEFLLSNNVEAVGIHASKDQQDRDNAVQAFRSGVKDVLVATDLASKGLDFANVQHVILYDMPQDIESYIHQIGRTGRGTSSGRSTVFVSPQCNETQLRDLKYVLESSGQKVPDFLQALK